ncbi:phosphopantetheine-binding protein [Alterileibacterium massiliense]|uniref:phosphopantetheine-binding protein n=1 Tax=Alterileibacterium massiliense TaxID=1870997 RepID=UPI0008DA774A|nr:phosphopantetheine-binding protein [Alterileibacterium massiliense]
MNERVIEILEDIRPDVDFEAENKLIDDDILDSFDIIAIVQEFNEEYDININPDDLEAENFNDVKSMVKLIHKLQEEDF